ncbi:MAG: acetyl-CoA synthase, partial [Thermodesulfobacteriota bacterium]
ARQQQKDAAAAELAALRQQRAAERAKRATAHEGLEHAAEDVEYGPGREAGVAGPEAVFIVKSLARWRLRGAGLLRDKA